MQCVAFFLVAIAVCAAMPDQYSQQQVSGNLYGLFNGDLPLPSSNDSQHRDKSNRQYRKVAVMTTNRKFHVGFIPHPDPERQRYTGAIAPRRIVY